MSKAGYDGRTADARIPVPRPNPNFRPNESQRFFETFLVILLALASWWAHIFGSGRGRYRNKLLSSLAKYDVLSWFLGGNQFDAFVGGFEIR